MKPDIQRLAGSLLDASEVLVRKKGSFLPHGAVLTESNQTRMVMAAPPGFEDRAFSSTEVLPLLHEVLRAALRGGDVRAVAVAEDVMITPDGQKQTAAIKVLFEHQRGLCVALYLPYHRRFLGGYRFGNVTVTSANPEVQAWSATDAS